MNFGDILEKWERQSAGTRRRDPSGNKAYDSSVREEYATETVLRGERRSRLLRKRPDDSIDLHGLTRDEAWTALGTFFENSQKKGCEKLLIIHGKGNHRSLLNEAPLDEGALRDLVRSFIEYCSFAGESGYSPAREGGTGATWVILKTCKP